MLLSPALIALIGVTSCQDSIAITWHPIAGQVVRYKIETGSWVGTTSWLYSRERWDYSIQVKSINNRLMRLESNTKMLADSHGSEWHTSPYKTTNLTLSAVCDGTGNPLPHQQLMVATCGNCVVPTSLQFSYPSNPVRLGETWQKVMWRDTCGTPEPSTLVTYTFNGLESVGNTLCFKVGLGMRPVGTCEDQQKFTGHYWLDVHSGWVVKAYLGAPPRSITDDGPAKDEPSFEFSMIRL